jgi:hypothetical protein
MMGNEQVNGLVFFGYIVKRSDRMERCSRVPCVKRTWCLHFSDGVGFGVVAMSATVCNSD